MAGENALVYHEQGGAKVVVASGGEIEVQSGGTLDLQSGSTVTTAAALSAAGGLTIPAAATLTVASTGIINIATGGIIKANGTQAAHIADPAADAGALATAVAAILVVLEGAGLTATS